MKDDTLWIIEFICNADMQACNKTRHSVTISDMNRFYQKYLTYKQLLEEK